VLILVLALPVLAVAQQIASDELIESLQPQGYVSDYAGVFSGADKRDLEALLSEVERKTDVELAVVALPSMQGGQIEDFAVRLYERWGIGKKGTDEGALLLTAIEDREVRIEVGYGLERLITDARAGRILDQYVIPRFKQGDIASGLIAGARAMAAMVAEDAGVALTGGGGPPPRPARGESSLLAGVFKFILIVVFVLFFIRHPFLALLLLSGGRGGGGVSGGGGFGGGGFGGFGGGLSGGGGASRGW
jgi:uncharacterized protein